MGKSRGILERNCRDLGTLVHGEWEAQATERVIAAIQADGTCWCGGTVWQGQTAMRISVSSWATTEADVERSLEAMLRLAGENGQKKVST